MCLIIYKPKNENFPSQIDLFNSWENNPDGAGLAIIDSRGVKVIKGIMTFKGLLEVLDNNEGFYGYEVALHFRWATSGEKTPDLCHPFPVSTKKSDYGFLDFYADKVILHNGVLFTPMINEGKNSDTKIFSRLLAYGIEEKRMLQILGNDRLVIAEKTGMRLVGNWIEYEGVFLSNNYGMVARPKWSETWDIDYTRNDILDACPCCDSDNIELIGLRTCTYECLDCETVFNETEFLISENYKENELLKVGI